MREQADAGDALAALEYSWALAQGEHGLDHDAVMSMQYARRAVELAKSSGEDHIAGEALFTLANLRGDEEVREEVWRELPGADSRRCQLQDGDKHVLDALKRAAALGHARARLALAETLQGSGGDDASIDVLLRSAADQGLPEAMVALSTRLLQRSPSTVNRRHDAIAWLRNAASKHCNEARYQLAELLLRDDACADANEWVLKLTEAPPAVKTAEAGEPDAALTKEVLGLLTSASLSGHTAAQLLLGVTLAASGDAFASCLALSRCALSPQPSMHRAVSHLLLARAYISGSGVVKSLSRAITILQAVIDDNVSDYAPAKTAAMAELHVVLHCTLCGASCNSTLGPPGATSAYTKDSAVYWRVCPDCDVVLLCGRFECVDAHEETVHATMNSHGEEDESYEDDSSSDVSSDRSSD